MDILEEAEVSAFLAHYGVKGMHWGVRKEQPPTQSDSSQTEKKDHTKLKKAAVILGSAALATAIAVGVIYAKKKLSNQIKVSDLPKPEEHAKTFTKALAEEPVSLIHAARYKNHGWTFPQRGGLSDPVHEYDRSGLSKIEDGVAHFKRYGDRGEKIAVRLPDPEGRKDASGRKLFHDFIIPDGMSKDIHTMDDVIEKVWPLVKDAYSALYDRP